MTPVILFVVHFLSGLLALVAVVVIGHLINRLRIRGLLVSAFRKNAKLLDKNAELRDDHYSSLLTQFNDREINHQQVKDKLALLEAEHKALLQLSPKPKKTRKPKTSKKKGSKDETSTNKDK